MFSDRTNQEEQPPEKTNQGRPHLRYTQRENISAALALLLGPETDSEGRIRATRRLAKQGPSILPLLLTMLNTYPEITLPSWPWWPPQYEHCSRLLLYLCKKVQLRLENILQHPDLTQPIGPVLWISVIEATGLLPQDDYETLLCQGLETSWMTVRYAAALALATRASKVALHVSTLDTLYAHQHENETFPIRLTTSYALLHNGKERGLEVFLQFIDPLAPEEFRKAAIFLLATDPPAHLSHLQRDQLTSYLIPLLEDSKRELALHAAHALSKIALPSALSTLSKMLDHQNCYTQFVVLSVLEELARQPDIRYLMRQQGLPTLILPLLKAEMPEVRRQASYTLAVCGGEYVTAALGIIVLNKDHPGHIEAIEALRVLHDVLHTPTRLNITRWLLLLLPQSQEEIQVTILDSLTYLLWQAHMQTCQQAWHEISQEIILNGTVLRLIDHLSPWVRQRVVELLMMLGNQLSLHHDLHMRMLRLLHRDNDSSVRACVAYACGQMAARWAIPDLILSLLDPNEHVAQTALNALGQLATPDDMIIVYVITEITYDCEADSPTSQKLAQDARAWLKKWQDSSHRKKSAERKKLHSSRSEPIL